MPRNKATQSPKLTKSQRERSVLFGLIELYIETGTPVGSNTLRDFRFKALSSATIRNYFATLEDEGYLIQHHSSGGRIPSEQAYKLYAHNHKKSRDIGKNDLNLLTAVLQKEQKELKTHLQQGLETLSELSGCACFMLAPRFDQDMINNVKLLSLDANRFLCVLMTDFGFVHTETIFSPEKLSQFSLKRIEDFFLFRIINSEQPTLSDEELTFANQVYNEVVLRHIIAYSNFDREDVYKSGFSNLLKHREFKDLGILSASLSLFESSSFIRSLLSDCFRSKDLKFWIGSDLDPYMKTSGGTSLIAIPYFLNNAAVGAIAILGPDRLDYKKVFGLLKNYSKILSESLTKTLCKNKITYRNPHPSHSSITCDGNQMLIENQNP